MPPSSPRPRSSCSSAPSDLSAGSSGDSVCERPSDPAAPPLPVAAPPAAGRPDRGLPPYTKWLLGFQGFNALSFTLCLGAPMVLTARYLGAKESWIGVMISLTPFLVIMQLFATNTAERWGYRRLMLSGWTARAFALLAIVPLPLLVGRVPSIVLVVAMFAANFAFNFIRGFASGTWFPWLTQLIPDGKRGLYLGWDNTIINLSALLTLFASAAFLGDNPAGWRYSALYGISIAAAFTSVFFLRRVPHRMPAAAESRSGRSVAQLVEVAKDIWSRPSFRRITRYVSLYVFALAAVPGFLVLYLKEELHWGDGKILYLQAASTIGVSVTALWWGRICEQAGSRPLMRLASIGNLLVLLFWVFTSLNWDVAGRWIGAAGATDWRHWLPATAHPDPGMWIAGIVFLLMGLFGAAHGISHMRLIMANCPEDELTVATTVFQVVTSLAMGAGPLLWGVALESLRASAVLGAESPITAFSIFFVCSLGMLLAAQMLLSRVPEPKALPATGLFIQIFLRWPLRVLSGAVLEKRDSGNRSG